MLGTKSSGKDGRVAKSASSCCSLLFTGPSRKPPSSSSRWTLLCSVSSCCSRPETCCDNLSKPQYLAVGLAAPLIAAKLTSAVCSIYRCPVNSSTPAATCRCHAVSYPFVLASLASHPTTSSTVCQLVHFVGYWCWYSTTLYLKLRLLLHLA